MLYKLTNNSGGEIVCDFATKGKTLRLNNKQSTTVESTEITDHINRLINKGLLLSTPLTETRKKTVTRKSNSTEVKEENSNV